MIKYIKKNLESIIINLDDEYDSFKENIQVIGRDFIDKISNNYVLFVKNLFTDSNFVYKKNLLLNFKNKYFQYFKFDYNSFYKDNEEYIEEMKNDALDFLKCSFDSKSVFYRNKIIDDIFSKDFLEKVIYYSFESILKSKDIVNSQIFKIYESNSRNTLAKNLLNKISQDDLTNKYLNFKGDYMLKVFKID